MRRIFLFTMIMVLSTACGRQDKGGSDSSSDPLGPRQGEEGSFGEGLVRWANLPVPVALDITMSEQEEYAFLSAVELWEAAAGRTLINLIGYDSENPSPSQISHLLTDDVNGIYLVPNWSVTEKERTVLAFTSWSMTSEQIMTRADIFFNMTHYNWVDSLALRDRRVDVDFMTVMLHELGHFFGLPHVEEDVDPDSIMNPTIRVGKDNAVRQLSRSDIEAIQRRYLCASGDCELPEPSEALSLHDVAASLSLDNERIIYRCNHP